MIKKRFYVAIFALLFFICAVIPTVFGTLFEKKILVEGTLKKYNNDNAVIEYSINGEKKWYKVTSARDYEDGEKVVLEYNEKNVNNVNIASKASWGTFWFISGIFVIYIFPKVYEYIIYCNIPKKGTKIEVEYLETIKIVINSTNSFYEMKFKWENPQDNKVYYLKNIDFIEFNPHEIIKEKNITTFTAYINPKRPKHYRVMLDNLLESVHLNKQKIIMM